MRSYILTDRELGEILVYLEQGRNVRKATSIVRNCKSLAKKNLGYLRNQIKILEALLAEDGKSLEETKNEPICPLGVMKRLAGIVVVCNGFGLHGCEFHEDSACTWEGWPDHGR